MGNGLAEVGLLAVLTIVVLPCCFFTLLALLDRFERDLDPQAQTPAAPVVKPTPSTAAAATEHLHNELEGADVVSLPIAVTALTTAEAPAAATG